MQKHLKQQNVIMYTKDFTSFPKLLWCNRSQASPEGNCVHSIPNVHQGEQQLQQSPLIDFTFFGLAA